MTRRGFTLTEVLMTVIVIGILASMAIPNYARTIQQGHWRLARDTLQTIYFGEKFYATWHSGQYFNNPTTQAEWNQIYMDDPNVSNMAPLAFSVNAPTPPGTSFTATATYLGAGPCGGNSLAIDQDQVLNDAGWPAPGNC